jgi:hypothetical protein
MWFASKEHLTNKTATTAPFTTHNVKDRQVASFKATTGNTSDLLKLKISPSRHDWQLKSSMHLFK